ncbi:MAG: LVIVD repeat-containing protein, partial [Stellaceae bacterium]
MGQGKGVREVAWLDCAGGGQVVVDGHYAYIGHIDAPAGTTVVDVEDPKRPRIVAEISIPHGLHSHKVRAQNGVMVVNREHHGQAADGKHPGRGGLMIYDIANPRQPKPLRHWECDGNGVHRFTFDGRYAYISPEMDGYVGNIVLILDLADPAKPQEVGRWWMPGQHIAGGETPTWKG